MRRGGLLECLPFDPRGALVGPQPLPVAGGRDVIGVGRFLLPVPLFLWLAVMIPSYAEGAFCGTDLCRGEKAP